MVCLHFTEGVLNVLTLLFEYVIVIKGGTSGHKSLGGVHKILYFVPFEYLVGIIRQKSKPDGNTMLEELHWETLDVVYRIIHPTQANLLEKAEKEMLIRY